MATTPRTPSQSGNPCSLGAGTQGDPPPESCELICVSPAHVAATWPHVEGLIAKAMRRGDMGRTDELRSAVLAQPPRALLWVVISGGAIVAAVVTQVVDFEASRACLIHACGGHGLRRWIGLISDIEDYGARIGCDSVRLIGRPGWSRVLPGYAVGKVVLEKRLAPVAPRQ